MRPIDSEKWSLEIEADLVVLNIAAEAESADGVFEEFPAAFIPLLWILLGNRRVEFCESGGPGIR